MSEDECRSLQSSALDLGVPCEFARLPGGEYEVFLGIENIERGQGMREYHEGIAFLSGCQVSAIPLAEEGGRSVRTPAADGGAALDYRRRAALITR